LFEALVGTVSSCCWLLLFGSLRLEVLFGALVGTMSVGGGWCWFEALVSLVVAVGWKFCRWKLVGTVLIVGGCCWFDVSLAMVGEGHDRSKPIMILGRALLIRASDE
jgi:hypothetical protein